MLRNQLPKLAYSDGAIEALKWLALIAMTFDHVNKAVFNVSMPGMSEFGRIAMPIFGWVLAYNLTRPEVISKKIHFSAMRKMAISGLIATPFYYTTLGNPTFIHLNIMFTLMLLVGIVYLIEKGGLLQEIIAICLFICGGLFVDYLWFGLAYCLAAWFYLRSPDIHWLVALIFATASLYFMNESHWALLSLPIIYFASKVDLKIKRLKFLFYIYYPLHLMMLWSFKTFQI